ncbi:MAG: hypothetical protein IJX25_04050 [Clostridia bacterium]|nr:hypothetical protein [Clostridia bacterium]MBQ8792109.1 hypothetical protein [Clostridia bacterium]
MSFYINNTNTNRPGPINSSALNGICEKVLIEATKVFDSCVSRSTESGIILELTGFNPANPVLPLTYISAENQIGSDVIVSDIEIERIENNPNFANVSMNITIPITVTYRDAEGTIGTATSSVVVSKCSMLFVPQPALTPVTIKATALFSSRTGTFNGDNTFIVTACLQIVIKVTAEVDLLLPSFGYPVIPPCQTCESTNKSCPGIENLPLYPTATTE